jgi:hypothetical protein
MEQIFFKRFKWFDELMSGLISTASLSIQVVTAREDFTSGCMRLSFHLPVFRSKKAK